MHFSITYLSSPMSFWIWEWCFFFSVNTRKKIVTSRNWLLRALRDFRDFLFLSLFFFFFFMKGSLQLSYTTIRDGAYFCYCAYVLRIWRYSGFLWAVPTNTGIFSHGLKLCGENRTRHVLLVPKIKIGGNHAFLRDNEASIWKKTPYIALYSTSF